MNTIEELPNGQWIVAGDTHLGKWAKEHGTIVTDPHLMKWLKPHVEKADVVWDVGENIGDHTRQYLDWGNYVVAIEPNPVAFECLEHNCPEAITIEIAASDKVGELRFTQLENVGASRISADGSIRVPAYPLDEVEPHLPEPQFVKIDIEGFEVFALRGMLETLRRCRPTVFCEVNLGALDANGVNRADIFLIFDELDYQPPQIYPPGASFADEQYDLLFLP